MAKDVVDESTNLGNLAHFVGLLCRDVLVTSQTSKLEIFTERVNSFQSLFSPKAPS